MEKLFDYATRQEVILEEVFLHDDENEEFNTNVYADNTHYDIMYAVSFNPENVRVYKLTDEQETISVVHRDKILNYRLNNPTDDDEVYLGDIFMQGEHIVELKGRELQNHILLLFHL